MENKKHILFISSWYPNRNNPTHGIFNRYFADAARIYNNVSVLHVCSDETISSEFEFVESTDNDIKTLTVYYKKITSSFPLLSEIKKHNRVVRAFELGYEKLIAKTAKPDLIQLNVILPMGVGARHLAKKYNIPYVVNENWSGYCAEDGNYKGFMKQFFTKKIVKDAKAIMPTSEFLEKAMLSHNLGGNYFVVPNVVNVNVFKPTPSSVNGSVTKLIHVSSLNDREKNVSGLIRAFHKAQQKVPALELNIVGEGIDKEKYQDMVKELGLTSKVLFKGRVLSKDLVNELNSNDALVMFSNYETFSLVIIEAFACGKPVITSNAGAIESYMQPEFGIMVDKKNEEQLTKAIIDFAGNAKKYDRDLIRKFAVENYSYEKIGEKLNSIYNFALKNTK